MNRTHVTTYRAHRVLYLVLLLLLTFHFSHLHTQAQENTLSMRDSRYVQFTHSFLHSHLPVTLEHSIYSEKISLQHFRLYAGYSTDIGKHLQLSLTAYAGSTHKGSYQDYGARFDGTLFFDSAHRYNALAVINPHQDSGLGYKTCYSLSTQLGFLPMAALHAEYTTIPEFRQSEQRIRVGICLHVESVRYGQLRVTPLLSIPLRQRYEKIRLHVNFDYHF